MPQKGNFAATVFGRRFGFGHNFLRAAAVFAAANIRHDAISAKIVATLHYGKPCRNFGLGGVKAGKTLKLVAAVGKFRVDLVGAAFVFCRRHRFVKSGRLARAQHEIYMRGAFNEFFTFLLRHATHNAQNKGGVFPLEVQKFADFSVDFFFGGLADATGVYYDKVGFFRVLFVFVADFL